jgi:hypothetical protein
MDETHATFLTVQTMLETLSRRQLELLRQLCQRGANHARELAQALGRDYKNVYQGLAVLDATGFLERVPAVVPRLQLRLQARRWFRARPPQQHNPKYPFHNQHQADSQHLGRSLGTNGQHGSADALGPNGRTTGATKLSFNTFLFDTILSLVSTQPANKKLKGKPGENRRRKATELKRCPAAQSQRGHQIRRTRSPCLLFPVVAQRNEEVDMRQTLGSCCAWRSTALHRLARVASPKPLPFSSGELGMRLTASTTMMNAEWPALLKFMGKNAFDGGRSLWVAEVEGLVRDWRLLGTVGGKRAGFEVAHGTRHGSTRTEMTPPSVAFDTNLCPRCLFVLPVKGSNTFRRIFGRLTWEFQHRRSATSR